MEQSSQYLINNEYTELYRRIPFKLQVAYGIGHVLNDICASMWFTYLLVFFHLVLQFSNTDAGLVLLIGQIADAIATPFVGFHSDQTDGFWFCRYGRRKTWHLFGTICVIGAFPFIFAPCEEGDRISQLFYYSMFVIIFQFGWASVQISHLSLIPELTPNEHDRTKLTAVRYCFTVFSNLLVYVITWWILHIGTGSDAQIGPSDTSKFRYVVWSGMVVGILCSIIFHICVKEGNGYSGNDVRGSELRVTVSDLLCNIQIYQVALVYMSTRLFVNLSQIFIPLYLHESLSMAASALALVPLTMFIGSFITAMSIEALNRGLGRRLSYILGSLLGLTACLWVKLRSGEHFVSYEIYVVAVFFGAGSSVILVTSLGITADLIGDKTGSGAFIYGIMSFCDKLANGVAVIVIQNLHADSSKIDYYKNVLTYVCGGSVILGSLAVISSRNRLRESRQGYEQIPDYPSINSEPVTSRDIQPSLIS